MTSSPFALALDCRATLGESPVWSIGEEVLWFADIKGKRLHRFDPASGEASAIEMPEEIGCFALAKGGGFIAAFRSGVYRLDTEGRVAQKLADNPEDLSESRFNDGRCDASGRFFTGTVNEKRNPTGNFYRYDRNGLAVVESGVTTSNGTAFSPDGRTLYFADTPRFTVFAYDYDPATGAAANRRVFAELKPTDQDRGRPDGAAVDSQGCYWTALYEGGRVQRYSPAGDLLAEYPVPARCPTMVAFGGPDLRTLFVTTARGGRPEEELAELPHSGGVFSMRVDVAGLPEAMFDTHA